jgi:hypothetical protein
LERRPHAETARRWEADLKRINPLILDFQCPEYEKINFYCLRHQTAVFCYGNPREQTCTVSRNPRALVILRKLKVISQLSPSQKVYDIQTEP